MSSVRRELVQQARATTIYSLGRVGPSLLAAVFTLTLIRTLQPSAYAQFSMVLIASMVVASMSVGWLRQGILRYRFHEVAGVLRSLRRPTWGSTLIFGVGSFLILTTPISRLAALGCLLVVVSSFHQVYLADLQARELPLQVVKREVIRYLLPVAGFLPLFLGIDDRLASPDGALMLLLMGYLGAHHPFVKGSTAVVSRRKMRDVLSRSWQYGWPMSLWIGASLATQYIDRYMLALLEDVTMAGIYSAGYDLGYKVAALALLPITLAAHPAYMRLRSAGDHRAAKFTLYAAGGAAVAATLVGATALILLHKRLSSWLGLDPALSRDLLASLFLISALWFFSLLAHKRLEYQEKTGYMLCVMLLSLVVNVAGNLVLIPAYSLWGATAATLGSTLVYLGGILVATRWVFRGKPRPGRGSRSRASRSSRLED